MSETITTTITSTLTLVADPTTIAPSGVVTVSGAGTLAVYGIAPTAWSLVNEGRIVSDAGSGVSLASGGTVANVASGLIESGTTDGIRLTGGGAVLDNAGVILTGGVSASALYMTGGIGAVTNSGSIIASGTSAHAVDLLAGGILVNASTATISGGASAVWVGARDGYSAGIVGSVANAGTIRGGTGVALNASGTVTNQGWILGTDAVGIRLQGSQDVVLNDGLIAGDNGILLLPQDGVNPVAVTIVNAGTIMATGTSADAVGIGSGGTASLGSGMSVLVVDDPGSVFIGRVAPGNGPLDDNTLELAAGTVVGTLNGLGTQFVNFGQTTIDSGGSWTFRRTNTLAAGNILTDSGTLTNAGFLAVNGKLLVRDSMVNTGTIKGAVTLDAGARLYNPGGGTIIGGDSLAAVYGTHGSGTVVNAGIITAADTATLKSPGISLAAGGFITNASGGTIISGSYGGGVYLGGAGGTVVNAPGASIRGSEYGVFVVPNASRGTVINGGRIDAGVLLSGHSIYQPQSYLTLFNRGSGVITGVDGVQMGGFATATVINKGVIAGDRDGMILANRGTGEVYISNTGSIVTGTEFPEPAGIGIRLGSPGTITNASTGLIAGKSYGVYGYDGAVTVINAGTILSGVRLRAGFQNRVVVDPGAVFRGNVDGGAVSGLAPANATLELAKGALAGVLTGVGDTFLNFGSIIFDGGAQWRLSGDIAGLADGQTISGFAYGNTIEITGFTGTLVSYNDGTLTLDGALDLSLILPGTFAASQFVVTDTGGNTDITLMCFAGGTRIATKHGPVAVEHLRVGDCVMTLGGEAQPVVWIGCRKVDCRQHPKPHVVWPVRVAAGAFAPRIPARDLFLSPEHCIFRNGVMIPVKELIDDGAVRQDETDEVVYYHIELPKHAVILAEGLTVESYLDTDGKANFANGGGVVRLFPEFATLSDDAAFLWEATGAAPRQVTGPDVEAVRALLAKRAATRQRVTASRRRSASEAPAAQRRKRRTGAG